MSNLLLAVTGGFTFPPEPVKDLINGLTQPSPFLTISTIERKSGSATDPK